MKQSNFNLIKMEADEGKVFDWADLSQHTHEEETEAGVVVTVQDHLYATTLFLGANDSPENYVEVSKPQEE